jgi:deoxyribodipyrimidine photo-lyase
MPAMSDPPPDRLTVSNAAPADPGRDYVLYWQVMARRTRYNFALEHALDHAFRLGKPLVVLEALRAGYPFASDRLHRWAIDGMADNVAAYRRARVAHLAYVEPAPDAGKGLLETLAARACVVVTDEFPEFFLPRMLRAAGARLGRAGVRLEAVDGNGLLPLRCAGKAHVYAHQFRRHVQRELPAQLGWFPAAEPLDGAPWADIRRVGSTSRMPSATSVTVHRSSLRGVKSPPRTQTTLGRSLKRRATNRP